MKNLLLRLSILFVLFLNAGWISQSGSGVVSDNEVIVRTSLEATQVLRSDLLSNLLGETRLGGAVNYASFDSGGLFSQKNVTSSRDTVYFANNQTMSWVTTAGDDGRRVSVGVSADDHFVVPASCELVSATSAVLFGDPTTNGSWKIVRSGDDIVFEQREAGRWNVKSSISGT